MEGRGCPARRIFPLLTHPEIVRRFSDHPPWDFVLAAFAYALEEDISSQEREKPLGDMAGGPPGRRERTAGPGHTIWPRPSGFPRLRLSS